MYSSIANDSFSYLLTLDDMRKNLPEETRPSWVKVTTITMISSFKREIDIKKLRSIFEEIGSYKLRRDGSNTEGFEWKLKPTTFYNQVTLSYHDNYSTKSVKVFPNGSIQVAGCCDLFDCKRVITQLVYIFKKFLNMDIDSISTDTFRVVMINSNFSLNYNINLMKVANWFEEYDDIFKVSFEPDRYSAVKIKFKPAHEMKEITCSIFSTGKIIITGAETLKEIAFAYNTINQHINENVDIRVSRTEETDVFDIFLGYKCDPFIKKLREKGFESWMKTITNRRINF
jgi:TATA-box binding protein (TBP) (component of TFIID and TFIIIB)